MHFVVEYTDKTSCRKDISENSGRYSGYIVESSTTQTATLYRTYSYQKDENDKKWTTEKNVDGYSFTGNTEYR